VPGLLSVAYGRIRNYATPLPAGASTPSHGDRTPAGAVGVVSSSLGTVKRGFSRMREARPGDCGDDGGVVPGRGTTLTLPWPPGAQRLASDLRDRPGEIDDGM
jgi:hypothetical protein